MRLVSFIAPILLLCTMGSLLWCADACVGASGNTDEDCTCLLGGLLAGKASNGTFPGSSMPGAQAPESCHCLCQSVSLEAGQYVFSFWTVSSRIGETGLIIAPSHSDKDILHPPRVS